MKFGFLTELEQDNTSTTIKTKTKTIKDARYKFLSNLLLDDGYGVEIFDINNINNINNINILITPIPFRLSTSIILDVLNKNNIKILAGGLIDQNTVSLCEKSNIKVIDFFQDEQIAILNAVPTAEGAIQIAMQESPKTIFNSKCLVLGYGRCGKVLTNTLKNLGAEVSASYRNTTDLGYIKTSSLKDVYIKELNNYLYNFDFIFNTIPTLILNKHNLKYINKNSVIIDLATSPGGVDYTLARELGLNALYCPSLPSRVAPLTSAEILKDCLYKALNL